MTNLVARVRDRVERDPDRLLFIHRSLAGEEDRSQTYGALWRGAAAVAEALDWDGAPRRSLIVLPMGTDVLRCHLGTTLAGGIPAIHSHPSSKTPLEVYQRHLSHVIELLAPDVVLTSRALRAELRAPAECRVLTLEDVPETSDVEPSAWRQRAADEVAILQHSSGSTGLQKGIPLTHAMVLEQCDAYARALRIDPERDRICGWIPLYHDMGLFTSWLMPLLEGVKVASLDPFEWAQSPASLLRLIHDRRGTLCWQPNFAYNLLASRVREAELEGVDLSCMRGFTNCSEPVRANSHRVFLERFRSLGVRPEALWVCYAMAENAFAVSAAGSTTVPPRVVACDARSFSEGRVEPPGSGPALDVVSVGRAVEGCSARIVDAERRDLPEARIGEIAVRSPFTLREYHENAEATSASLDAEGWFYTGDLGFLSGGELFVTGRQKDLLIVGGRNFYPQDLEALASDCPHAVPGRCVAVGVPDEHTGTERVVVLVETRSTDPGEHSVLTAAIRRRAIEELDCPVSEVHAVPHMWLCKTTSGKIARAANLDRYREMQDEAGPVQARVAPTRAGWLATLAGGFALALVAYVVLTLQPNLSWGIYASF